MIYIFLALLCPPLASPPETCEQVACEQPVDRGIFALPALLPLGYDLRDQHPWYPPILEPEIPGPKNPSVPEPSSIVVFSLLALVGFAWKLTRK